MSGMHHRSTSVTKYSSVISYRSRMYKSPSKKKKALRGVRVAHSVDPIVGSIFFLFIIDFIVFPHNL